MRWHKIWLVTRYEYIQNVKRKAFLFTAFVMPLLIFGMIYLSSTLSASSQTDLDDYQQVGYLDESGILASVTSEDFERYIPYESEAALTEALENKDIRAYFTVPTNYMQSGQVTYVAKDNLPAGLEGDIRDFLAAGVANLADVDYPVERLQNPLHGDFKMQLLGEDTAIKEEELLYRFLLPMIFIGVIVMSVLTTSQFLMAGVVEEKENRIAELLLTSARPGEVMLGKFFGLGSLALTQVAYLLVLGLGFGLANGSLDQLTKATLNPFETLLTLVYFFLSFAMFSGISLAIGAAVAAEQESRQMAAVFGILVVVPIYGVLFSITNLQATHIQVMTVIPFTAPTTVLILMGLGAVQTWQIVVSLISLVLTNLAIMWMSAKIFRFGMLQYDQRLSLKQVREILAERV